MMENNVPFLFDFVEDTETTVAEAQAEHDSGSCDG